MSIGRQPLCSVCAKAPVAMRGVTFCFTCWPSGPVTPPPCLRCGSSRDYYASGLCARCHTQAIPTVGSCLDCYAWGATRKGTQALTRPEVRPFDISKNPMSGWVMVSPDVLDDNTLNEWLERARDFVSTLPPK